eukprot:6045571-Karenia_brevis.AAC.1
MSLSELNYRNPIGGAFWVPDLGELGVILGVPMSLFDIDVSESQFAKPPGIRFGKAGRDSGGTNLLF